MLAPLGFPASKLGLRSLVAADRARGSQLAAATLGRVWHAAPEPGPLIISPLGVSAAEASGRTLVIIFSSLGWHGVVRAEWGATLRAVGDGALVLAHVLDTAQSWFQTNPTTGEWDDGHWWDGRLAELCAPYARVCVLGESMGATGTLRFARHATVSAVALVPQIDVRDFGESYAGRADFGDARKGRLREAIGRACWETSARVVLHVGQDPPDLKQLSYLPSELPGERLEIVLHDVPGHALGAGLKAQGMLRKVILRDLLGHTYRLPPAREGGAPAEVGPWDVAPPPVEGLAGQRFRSPTMTAGGDTEAVEGSGEGRGEETVGDAADGGRGVDVGEGDPPSFGMAECRGTLQGVAIDQLIVVTDFDLTLTTGTSEQCHDVLGASPRLPAALRRAFEPLLDFSTPFPPELASDGWWSRANELLVAHGGKLTKDDVECCVREADVELRPGALRWLRRLAHLRVPTLVVSAGFTDVVEAVLKAADPSVAEWCRVSSNRLVFGEQGGGIVAVEPSTPCTSYNKADQYARNREWFESFPMRTTALVVGDKISDLSAMDGAPSSYTNIGVGVRNDNPDGESSRHPPLSDFRQAYDVVLCGDRASLDGITDLVDALATGKMGEE